jgi:aconitase B
MEMPLKFSSQTKIDQQKMYQAFEDKAKEVKNIKDDFRPVYSEIQAKIEAGDMDGAKRQLDLLTEDEYKIYKSLKRSDKTAENRKVEGKIFDRFNQIQELKDTNEAEAKQILDSFTEEEYAAYKRLKSKLK